MGSSSIDLRRPPSGELLGEDCLENDGLRRFYHRGFRSVWHECTALSGAKRPSWLRLEPSRRRVGHRLYLSCSWLLGLACHTQQRNWRCLAQDSGLIDTLTSPGEVTAPGPLISTTFKLL